MSTTLVLLAKCPQRGTCKTRLIPAFGEDAVLELATAMLTDVLVRFGTSQELTGMRKVLLYAPPGAETEMVSLLQRIGLQEAWHLEPINTGQDLASSNLSVALQTALISARKTSIKNSTPGSGTVIFIGMDTPDLPTSAILEAETCGGEGMAYICPAEDGGYVLLGVPNGAPPLEVFKGVDWSTANTCASQIQAIEACNIGVNMGPTYCDIDEPSDVESLVRRNLQTAENIIPATLVAAKKALGST